MQQVREEHKQLEINGDSLTNISKNQKSHNINLTDFVNNTLIYVYALKQINTRYGLNFTKIGCLSDELNEQTMLFQFRSNSYLNSQLKIDEFNKLEFGNILANGSISGYTILSLTRKYNFAPKKQQSFSFPPNIQYSI